MTELKIAPNPWIVYKDTTPSQELFVEKFFRIIILKTLQDINELIKGLGENNFKLESLQKLGKEIINIYENIEDFSPTELLEKFGKTFLNIQYYFELMSKKNVQSNMILGAEISQPFRPFANLGLSGSGYSYFNFAKWFQGLYKEQ